LISSDSSAELSLPSHCDTKTAELVINARVAIDPDVLAALVDQAVRQSCAVLGISPEFRQTQSFRPGRPVPTHRLGAPSQD
jgi:hypothetical protein